MSTSPPTRFWCTHTQLSAWEKPYPIEPKTDGGGEVDMRHWDPDCFRIGDSYYAFSASRQNRVGTSSRVAKTRNLTNVSAQTQSPDCVTCGLLVSLNSVEARVLNIWPLLNLAFVT